MATNSKVTFEVPGDLRGIMDAHPEVNWSAVLRQAIARHARILEIARQLVDEDEDPRIQAVTDRLRRGVADRFRRAQHARRR